MNIITVESIKKFGVYVEYIEGKGYLYEKGDQYFIINGKGITSV